MKGSEKETLCLLKAFFCFSPCCESVLWTHCCLISDFFLCSQMPSLKRSFIFKNTWRRCLIHFTFQGVKKMKIKSGFTTSKECFNTDSDGNITRKTVFTCFLLIFLKRLSSFASNHSILKTAFVVTQHW